MSGAQESQTLDDALNVNRTISTKSVKKLREVKFGEKSPHWKGGVILRYNGYYYVRENNGYIKRSRYVCEKILGKSLPKGSKVHHVNKVKTDDKNCNLVICQNHKYHHLLHMRMNALLACGNSRWRRCAICHNYDDPDNVTIIGNRIYHKKCAAQYQRNRKNKA